MKHGYVGKALDINLSTGEIQTFEIPELLQKKYIGGRGFIARWLIDRTDPDTGALDAENSLIFATGPLTGTIVPTSARLAVGALAPETNIMSIGSVGGSMGAKLKRAGWDAVIISGKSAQPVYLLIDENTIELKSAQHLWGFDVYQTEQEIRQQNKNYQLSIASIGPSGENAVQISTIMVDRVRSAGRGGLGAVMGSKNLKAVAVYGSGSVSIHDPKAFWKASLDLQKKAVKEFFKKRWTSGTYGALTRYNSAGALTSFNAQRTEVDFIDAISAEHYNSNYKIGMRACTGCSMPCWSTYSISEGDFAGKYSDSVNASTFKELGARCGMQEMDAILQAHDDLNRFGLDTISTPAVISFAMECFQRGIISEKDTNGLALEWGEKSAVLELIRKIAYSEGFGAQLALGVRECARIWGGDAHKYALHVKGMETVATDPRGQPSWGLGYATSSRGACHMRAYGNFEYGGMSDEGMLRIAGTTRIADRYGLEGKGKAVAFLENMHAFGDSLGTCKFMTRAELGFPEELIGVLNSATGMDLNAEELYLAGERIYNLERISNLQRGLTPEDDTLPERYTSEPVRQGPAKGKVCNLKPMLDEYYAAREWDLKNGYPSKERLSQIGLDISGQDEIEK